jgi:hypothetical protein
MDAANIHAWRQWKEGDSAGLIRHRSKYYINARGELSLKHAVRFGLPIIGRLLSHAQAATTSRYAHLDNDPLRRASEAIGGRIIRT